MNDLFTNALKQINPKYYGFIVPIYIAISFAILCNYGAIGATVTLVCYIFSIVVWQMFMEKIGFTYGERILIVIEVIEAIAAFYFLFLNIFLDYSKWIKVLYSNDLIQIVKFAISNQKFLILVFSCQLLYTQYTSILYVRTVNRESSESNKPNALAEKLRIKKN